MNRRNPISILSVLEHPKQPTSLPTQSSSMEALTASSLLPSPSLYIPTKRIHFSTNPKLPTFHLNPPPRPFLSRPPPSRWKLSAAAATTSSFPGVESTSQKPELEAGEGGFDWYAQWYPVMPLCDLDKRAPHAKKVMGLDVVVWWDRNVGEAGEWRVFADTCPHRLAPLSEGRIDQWGRLQCVYHGWCFNGSGDCKFIPQAPPDGPPVNTFKKACARVYPSTVHHDMVWFWPNSDPQFKDIILEKQPPSIPELEDPSFTKLMGNREIAYGYDILIENLMDPAHVPYAHYGLMQTRQVKEKVDREGGRPLEISVKKLDKDGYLAKQEWGSSKFIAPCIFYAHSDPPPPQVDQGNRTTKLAKKPPSQRRMALIFICVPVSPGNSRLIWVFPRNFGVWIDKVVPRWMFHIGQNLILDSDLYLLHLEERKIQEVGVANWQKACFVPTKSDALVVGFRRWLNKYAGGQVDWRGKYSGDLPPPPPREQLLDRYWSHTVNCRSCNSAYKGLNILEVVLQVISIAAIGIVAAVKQNAISSVARTALAAFAVVSFVASKWLNHFIHKNFHYHDYNHAFR